MENVLMVQEYKVLVVVLVLIYIVYKLKLFNIQLVLIYNLDNK